MGDAFYIILASEMLSLTYSAAFSIAFTMQQSAALIAAGDMVPALKCWFHKRRLHKGGADLRLKVWPLSANLLAS
ncbi:hypothetical protein [Pseudovibrio exalbescens]|uniref:hypothetical protein n=1 Tax=Pseudovibrio exalbescens TaxID=197461 RepID=UPI000C9CFD94|nr:hypothetical protein [Pseudovibrio exalbescens]